MATVPVVRIQNFVDGKFVIGGDRTSYIDSYDPSTGEVNAKVPDSTEEEANEAVAAAVKAFKTWSETPVERRSQLMLRVADLLESQLDAFAEAESRDQGKPLWLARTVEIPRAVLNFRSFATSILHHVNTSTHQESFGSLNYTLRQPAGVAVLISPWNLPLYLLTFKIAPAIACGNTVVCKPSEMTSLTAFMLCRVLSDAGVPPGVVNMVFGTGPRAGHALVSHPDIRLVSFTGSTATAAIIRSAAAPLCKKLSLELGGKNAAVIFGDADLEKVVPTTVRSSFMNQGEVCLCTSRIFVHHSIFDDFLTKFCAEVKQYVVGDPMDSGTKVGALISKEHLAKVKGYIKLARDEGCKIAYDADINLPERNKQGYFLSPVVITGVSDDSRLMKEEIFGPVTCVVPFNDEQEVIGRVNDVQYGLCATVWSQNANTVHRVAQKLQVGTVWANCWLVRDLHMPFGGVKASGVGREGIQDSVEFYTEAKTICIDVK